MEPIKSKVMKYIDLIKKYGKDKGENVMWKAAQRISDYLEEVEAAHPDVYWSIIKDTYRDMCGGHYNEEFGKWQISEMSFVDKHGTEHHAPRWTTSQYGNTYLANKGRLPGAYNMWDWAVTLEMMYTDNYCLFKEWWPGASEADLDNKFIQAAVNWLNDKDNPFGDEKVWGYFNH
ncbi:MAG: hypothetical protein IIW98_08840 [Bacteroidaceae bacterium]|nr:hypothetical protein [Bacteroidaceae bacterium]